MEGRACCSLPPPDPLLPSVSAQPRLFVRAPSRDTGRDIRRRECEAKMPLLPISGRWRDGPWSGMGREAVLRILGERQMPIHVPVG